MIGISDEFIVSLVGIYGVIVIVSDGCKVLDVVEVKDVMVDFFVIKIFFEDKGFYFFDIRINGFIILWNVFFEKFLINMLCDEVDLCVGNLDVCV